MTLDRDPKSTRRAVYGLIAVALVLLAWAAVRGFPFGTGLMESAHFRGGESRGGGDVERLTFAETWEFWTAPTLVAGLLDLYEEVGLDVKVAKFPTGLASKNAVLTHTADVGLVAVTPIANAALQDEDVTLIATYFESDVIVKLVGRADRGDLRPELLEGRRVGYVPGTISELVLERMVVKYDLDRESLRLASFRPTELVYALERGDVDAFVAWEPLGIHAHRILGDQVQEFVDPDLYTVSLHLVTRPDVIRTKPEALERFLQALELAVLRLREDPAEMRALIEEDLGFRPGELAPIWPQLRFGVRLDEDSLLERIRRDAEWVVYAGYADEPRPSYDGYVDTRIYDGFRSGPDLQTRAGRGS